MNTRHPLMSLAVPARGVATIFENRSGSELLAVVHFVVASSSALELESGQWHETATGVGTWVVPVAAGSPLNAKQVGDLDVPTVRVLELLPVGR